MIDRQACESVLAYDNIEELSRQEFGQLSPESLTTQMYRVTPGRNEIPYLLLVKEIPSLNRFPSASTLQVRELE
jgi:hypothetical protein